MGCNHHTCCSGKEVKRGFWSPDEDEKLRNYIMRYGCGRWSTVPNLAGLQRCGKSCRLRWINYLRPDLKRGGFTDKEICDLIELHGVLGNKWSQIVKHMPGRTDNEIKNFWNSSINNKLLAYYKAHVINKPAPQLSHNLSISSDVIFNNSNNNNNMFFPNAPVGPQMYIPKQIHMSIEGFAPTTDPKMFYNTNLAPPSIQVPNNDLVPIPNNNLPYWPDQYSYNIPPQMYHSNQAQVFVQNNNSMFGGFNDLNMTSSSIINSNPQVQAYPMQQEHMVLSNDNYAIFGCSPDEPSTKFSKKGKEIDFDEVMPFLSTLEQQQQCSINEPLILDEGFTSFFPSLNGTSINPLPVYPNNTNNTESLMESFESLIPNIQNLASASTLPSPVNLDFPPLPVNIDLPPLPCSLRSTYSPQSWGYDQLA